MKDYFETMDAVSGRAFLAMQGIFAAMPLIVGRTMRKDKSLPARQKAYPGANRFT